jgi:hypothetical protein
VVSTGEAAMAEKVKKMKITDEVLSLAWIFLLSIVVVRDNSMWGIMVSAGIFIFCYSLFLAARILFLKK